MVWAKKPKENLSFDAIKTIVSDKSVTKSTLIGLEGGEFLLHPEANEIMSYLDRTHPKYDLLSNCVNAEKTVKAVQNHRPQRLFISLDGKPETHAFMRGNDGYSAVKEVVEKCKDKLPVSVMFTLTPYNSFDDLIHVAELCKYYQIDMRVGIYNNMPFFDTVDDAHMVNNLDNGKVPDIQSENFVKNIPELVKDFDENYDFMVLYDFWRKGKLFLKCNSILDSIIVLPNGDVPVCQNLSTKLGNIHEKTLFDIINSKESIELHKKLRRNCNKCWINFHRKYDIILYRSAEKYGGRKLTKLMFGNYYWDNKSGQSYKKLLKRFLTGK